MNFIDRTGHIFSIEDYNEYPIGYEYEETPYIFWFDTERGSKLSINNYYFKPIRIVNKVSLGSTVNIDIKIENSNKFYLVDSDIIDKALIDENVNDINDSIKLFERDITSCQHIQFTENININANVSEDADPPFKGCLVDDVNTENPIMVGTQTYYINVSSGREYNGEIFEKNQLEGQQYLDSDGNYKSVSNSPEGTKFGQINIVLLPTYVRLEERTRTITANENNSSSLSNVHQQDEYYLINTFYVAVYSDEQGIWSTNVLINVDNEWCPITVSAEIIDEQEELIINGINIGTKFPKEIVQAIYSGNYNITNADEKTYYLKMKEYLMNYMQLKGEIGNYRSALNSLKWFEWGDKLSISKLIRNDNRIQKQYIKDFFDLINDNLYSYCLFKDTALLSIDLKITEDGEQEEQNLNATFWGEGKPVVTNKINSLKEISYDEKEYVYYRGYFDFTFNDLGLKLAALKYYYEKYFLPLYIRIHSISINQHVYANDIKLINKTMNGITENPIFITNEMKVIDPETNKLLDISINNDYDIVYFNRYYKHDENQTYAWNENNLYIDENYNLFTNYTDEYVNSSSNTFYRVNDTCLFIPISFPHLRESFEYYDVTLILSRYVNKNNESILTNDDSNLFVLLNERFSFIQTDNSIYEGIIIYPKIINENNSNKFDIMYWLNNKFRLDLIVNNKPYELIFTVKMPEFNIEMGKLEYKYDEKFRQLSSISGNSISFNAYMYLPNLVNVNNIDFDEEIIQMSENISEYVNKYYTTKLKFLNNKYLNACHLLEFENDIQYNGPSDENTICMNWGDRQLYASANQNVSLYNNFFNSDGSYKNADNLIINDIEYDLYLMHDYQKWYVVLISKEPVDYNKKSDGKFKFNNGDTEATFGSYTLVYKRSDRKFLINRFRYIPSEGINHFRKDDIIVASLKNNDKLCFKLTKGSKWTISPLSLKMQNVNVVHSNTELAIISIADKFKEYERGYYSLSIEYCIDDIITHIYTNRVQFRIDE